MSDYTPKSRNTLPIIFDDRMHVNNLIPKIVNRVNDNTEDLTNLYEETEAMQEDVAGKIDAPETAGTAGQVLTTDGTGGTAWTTIGSGEIVVDPTLSIQGAAADAKKTGDEITLVKQDIKQFDPLISSLMEQGSYATINVGSPLDPRTNSAIIRTPDFSPWTAGKKVSLVDGFLGRLLLCDSNGNYITDASWGQNVTSSNSVATQVKVCVKKSNGANITPDEIVGAIVNTDIPLTIIHEKANASEFNSLSENVSNIETTVTEIDDTLYVYSTVPTEMSSGIYDKSNNFTNVGKHTSVSVEPGEKYVVVAGCYSSNDYPMYLLRKNGSVVSYKNVATSQMEQETVIIPSGVDELLINTASAYIEVQKGTSVSAKPFSKWKGKKIAWFGTSIPERSTYNAVFGYPEYVGKLLGATVYNEAVGSSCARRGFKTAETSNDPYGWTGMGQAALWNLGSTVAEKNEIIANWESKWRALTGYDQTLSTAMQNKAIACSYENKLMQYVSTNPVDLFVFDHGYNDWKVGDLTPDISNMFDRSTFQGAMNTFIKLILEANPRARIVIISHYEDQERAGLIEMQDNEAKYWNLPFCKLYEKLGWANDRTVTTEGYWSNGRGNGVWIASGGTSHTISLKEYHMPDGRHPNTDISGHACMDIAYVIANFLNEITPA